MCKNGFTLVEAIIAVLIIIALLAISIPILSERHEQQLRALAKAEPWEVFEFRVEPAKKTFSEVDKILLHCEIVNPTPYPLSLPEDLNICLLFFAETDHFVGAYRLGEPTPKPPIPPRGSTRFDLTFYPAGTGHTDFKIALISDQSLTLSLYLSVEGSALVHDGQSPFGNLRAAYPAGERRFQSHAFQVNVEKSDTSQLATFDYIMEEMKRVWEALPPIVFP